jgi:TetR/AcrR family transcriptional regulator, tetracycline repressor protein
MTMSKPRRKPGPGRPLQPLITREATAAHAIRIIDAQGLDALRVQTVAQSMGVTAPSLYYHFKDKDELLALVAFELLHQMGEGAHPDAPWEERMVELAVNTRRVILRHASAAPLLLRFFPRKVMLGAYERTLQDCPYPCEAHAAILDALEKLTYGASLFAAAAATHHIPALPTFSAERFPLLAAALEAGPDDEEALFVETLRALLDGFRARYRRKRKREKSDD